MPDSALNQAVAAELRRARKSLGLSQSELAERSGIPRVSIQRWEAGGTIKISDLGTLCRAMGVDPRVLFDEAVEKSGWS